MGNEQSAVFEYKDPDLTESVVAGMNNLDLAGNKISVQRVPISSANVLLKPVKQTSKFPDVVETTSPSTVLLFTNMVTSEDLLDDQLYEDLIADIADECNSFAPIKSVIIPRFQFQHGPDSTEVGKVFVECCSLDGAEKILKAISGRKFNGNIVEVHYFPENLFFSKVGR